jgi:hypothetical protein
VWWEGKVFTATVAVWVFCTTAAKAWEGIARTDEDSFAKRNTEWDKME